MKKTLVISNLLFASVNVLGMNSVDESNNMDRQNLTSVSENALDISIEEELERHERDRNERMQNDFAELMEAITNCDLEKVKQMASAHRSLILLCDLLADRSNNQRKITGKRWVSYLRGSLYDVKLFRMVGENGNSPLMWTLQNMDKYNQIRRKAQNLNQNDKVQYAEDILNRYVNIVKILIKQGANIDEVGIKGDTPLIRAIRKGYVNLIRCLMDFEFDVNKADRNGKTPLEHALIVRNREIVEYLRRYGVNVEEYVNGVDGYTKLIEAVVRDDIDTVKFLLELGVDINKRDKHGATLLLYAVWAENLNILKYLVEHGADVNKLSDFGVGGSGITPLWKAVDRDNLDMVRYLVEHGADVNKADKYARTPLIVALCERNSDIVRYLVEHGADVNKAEKDGTTPLIHALYWGNDDIVSYLEVHGAKLGLFPWLWINIKSSFKFWVTYCLDRIFKAR